MPLLKSIEASLERNERSAIPVGAMDHLGGMGKDRCFAGSVVFGKQIVPALFIKLSRSKARKIGFLSSMVFNPGYKFNTVEDHDHNLVSVVTFMRDGKPSLQVPLNPAHRAVQDFLDLVRTTECFSLDISVVSSRASSGEPYGSTGFLEVDGEHREWVGRNLVRSRSAPEANNWKKAFAAYTSSHYSDADAVAITFDQPAARLVDARRSTEFITRGDDDYEPDLSVVEGGRQSYRYGWLRKEHGLHIVDDPTLLIKDQAFAPVFSALAIDGLAPRQAVDELEKLRRRFPGESFVLSRLLILYRHLGDEKAEKSVLRELAANGDIDLLGKLILLSTLPPKERNEEWRRKWQHPEAHHYTEGERAVTLEEFFLFEEYSILELADGGKLPKAFMRFNRLVEFGGSEDLFRPSAEAIVRQVLKEEIERSGQVPRIDQKKTWPGVSPTAANLLSEAYLDHASFLINELEKRGVVAPPTRPSRRVLDKTGRNAPCFCGSGKKYKYCCGR
jgi:hypothetical protein